jgi:hypothetical protein
MPTASASEDRGEVADVVPVNQHGALGDVVEPGNEVRRRRLARPGRPDDRGELSRLHLQVHPAQGPGVAVGLDPLRWLGRVYRPRRRVAEGDVAELHASLHPLDLEGDGVGLLADGGLEVEVLEDPAEERQ